MGDPFGWRPWCSKNRLLTYMRTSISDINGFPNNFAPNQLLVQEKDEDTSYGIPLLSLVITGAVSVGTSLLLVFGAKMLDRLAERRKQQGIWSHWPTSPDSSSPLTSLDNSDYSSPNQSMDCETSTAKSEKL